MEKYPLIMRILHWSVGPLIILLLIAGFIMTNMDNSPFKFQIYGIHKSIGMTVLGLAVLRWLMRLTADVPRLPGKIPMHERFLAKLTYTFMYIAMIAMPLSGYLMSSWGGHPVAIFGYTLPEIVSKNPEYGKIAAEAHEVIAWVWVVLIALHLIGYFKHLLWDKENLLKRIV